MTNTVLDKIVETKKTEIARARAECPERELKSRLADAPPVRDFFQALAKAAQNDGIGLIAEVKKASPSKGIIREDFDPVAIARTYETNGAHCISVLTDEYYFQGNLDYLRAVREAVRIPVLRKDFLIDPYQLLQARVAGADAALLIAECLDDCQLRSMHQRTAELGMTTLIEFYQPENCQRVLDAGARLVGINNRDLRTFETDLQHSVRMRSQIPEDCLVVGESGIHGRADVLRLQQANVNALLVGEHLMVQSDVGRAVRQLLGTE